MGHAIILLFLFLGAFQAKADTTTIGGRQYATGLLKRAKDAPRTYFQPAYETMSALPDSYDSRTEGVIPAIRNQGNCGSCWSFATLGAFETALVLAAKSDSSINLAEQDALVNDKSAYGCSGGFMDGTFLTAQGATTEALCPYRASGRYSCNGAKFAKATRWALLGGSNRSPSVEELKQGIVQYGSLFVTVAAGGGFNPRNGRITTCSSSSVNHMVQLVAYRPAQEGGVEFLIKNSWGTSWGDAGYAWSKQGCNRLASSAGDAAGFFYVEGAPDPDDPPPNPAPLDLPLEVIVAKGHPVALQPVTVDEMSAYSWSTGVSGYFLNLQTTTSVTVSLKAIAADGSVTEQSVKVTVK